MGLSVFRCEFVSVLEGAEGLVECSQSAHALRSDILLAILSIGVKFNRNSQFTTGNLDPVGEEPDRTSPANALANSLK